MSQNKAVLAQKPVWLKKNLDLSINRRLKAFLRKSCLNTVCEESRCPNISECFGQGLATFLILGDICTRNCSFCAVTKGKPLKPDCDEPARIARAVEQLKLSYAVITSPTRDDLADRGAEHFSKTVKAVLALKTKKQVEILIPDFSGQKNLIAKVAKSGAGVIAHNLETVPQLYGGVRPGADYQRSLRVLEVLKNSGQSTFTKSGLMLGLGETLDQVKATLHDLRLVGCDFLTLGQYLPPSAKHYPLKEYISPAIFNDFKSYALQLGFKAVASQPYVRSSYMAHLMVST